MFRGKFIIIMINLLLIMYWKVICSLNESKKSKTLYKSNGLFCSLKDAKLMKRDYIKHSTKFMVYFKIVEKVK